MFPKINKKHYFRLRNSQGYFTNHFKSFNLYVSHRYDRLRNTIKKPVILQKGRVNYFKQKKQVFLKQYGLKKLKLFNKFKKQVFILNSGLVYIFNKNYLCLLMFIYKVIKKVFYNSSFISTTQITGNLVFFKKSYIRYKLFSLITIKCFFIYLKCLFLYFYRKYKLINLFNNFIVLIKYLFFNKIVRESIKIYVSLKLRKSKLNKIKSRINLRVDKKGHQLKRFEGISFKRLILFYVYKLTKISDIKIRVLNLENPKTLRKFFQTLKRNIKIRGPLQKIIFDLFLVLYHSLLVRNPKFFGFYISLLIKKNIKKIGQIFIILKVVLPSFCLLLKCRGIRVQLKGRINGARRSRVWKIQQGQIPLQTISSDVYYSFNKVMTIHGVYGLKI